MARISTKDIPFLNLLKGEVPELEDFLTPLPLALEELERRQGDKDLQHKVEAYLHNDIPEHFSNEPILYLARHIATPNFETLRFLHLIEPIGLKTVIGQDIKDKFVPKNLLKKSLAKLPVSMGVSSKKGAYHELFEYISILDFNTANGKRFDEIKTHWGEGLSDFHLRLLKEHVKFPVSVVDESEWIDRNNRGDLLEHYKKFLALFLVHGILLEDYALEDKDEKRFISEILKPAYDFIENEFGIKPLIAQLTPTSVESSTFWVSYPHAVKRSIENSREGRI